MTPLRLWVFNQHYPPDALATGQALAAWLPRLAARGWQVTVFAGRPYLLPAGEDWCPTVPEVRDGVRVVRLHSSNRRSNTVERLLHYGSYAALAARRWLQRERPDVALVLSTPPVLVGLVGVLGRTLRGVPFVYQVQDLFPDILATTRFHGTPWARGAARLAAIVEREAAAIAPIGGQLAQALRERGVPAARLHVIPNAVDVAGIKPIAPGDNGWRRGLGLPDDAFVALYAGNIGHAQGLDAVLDAAAALRQREPRLQFVIVGAGDGRAAFAARVAREQLANVRLLDFVPQARLNEVLAAADVGLVPLRPGMARFVVPSKTFAYLAAGTPVLAAIERDSELAQLIVGERVGVVVPPGDGAALAGALQALVADRRARDDAARRAASLVRERFGGDTVAAAWDALLRGVVAAA